MLKLYGSPQSRAWRVLWALEELGLPYEHIPTDHNKGESRSPDFLVLNPMGKVPVLVDGDFILTESIAITIYLATKNGSALWPAAPQAQARILQWSSWAITELEFHLTSWVRERRTAEPRAAYMASCLEQAAATLPALEAQLSRSKFVAGEDFTIGDVNTASAVRTAKQLVDISGFPYLQAWLETCLARPASQRAAAIT